MKNIKRIIFFPMVFSAVIFFSGCRGFLDPMYGYEYKFLNSTSYTVYISMDQDYNLSEFETPGQYSKSRPITVSPNQMSTVYITSKAASFKWTAGYSGEGSIYVYTEQNGSKVTFREREK